MWKGNKSSASNVCEVRFLTPIYQNFRQYVGGARAGFLSGAGKYETVRSLNF